MINITLFLRQADTMEMVSFEVTNDFLATKATSFWLTFQLLLVQASKMLFIQLLLLQKKCIRWRSLTHTYIHTNVAQTMSIARKLVQITKWHYFLSHNNILNTFWLKSIVYFVSSFLHNIYFLCVGVWRSYRIFYFVLVFTWW